jgi:hypothetical protein
MGWRKPLLPLCAIALVVANQAAAQTYYYPSKGQDPSQQSRDQAECGNWAYQQTGYRPGAPSPEPAPQGGAFRGATRGAAVGAIGGAIGGNAGKGAAIGAATGGVIGGMRRAEQTRQVEAQQAQGTSAYNRALAACMQGRGYSVN